MCAGDAGKYKDHSPVAQSVEQVAVNHWVRGSSPCWGAKQIQNRALFQGVHVLLIYKSR